MLGDPSGDKDATYMGAGGSTPFLGGNKWHTLWDEWRL